MARRKMQREQDVIGNFDAVVLEIDHLRKADDAIRKEMHNGFDSILVQIRALADDLKKNSQFNWPLFISILSFLLVCIIAVGGMAFGPLKTELSTLGNKFAQHTENGHPYTVLSKIDNLEQKLTAFQRAREREVDIQLDAMQERIDRIDYYGSAKWSGDGGVSAPHPEIRGRR